MTSPNKTTIIIRPFQDSDEQVVRSAIEKANIEPLALANKRAYFHPIVVATWLALSYVFLEWMHCWPSQVPGWLGYYILLQVLVSVAIAIKPSIDGINRLYFQKFVQDSGDIQNADLKNISEYYSKCPASGFWILECQDTLMGLLALDASPSTATSPPNTTTGVIRHFYVHERFRPAKIQHHMLKHAVEHAFTKSLTLQRIEAPSPSLLPYLQPCLRDLGFTFDDQHTNSAAVFRWKVGKCYLEKGDWKRGGNDSEL